MSSAIVTGGCAAARPLRGTEQTVTVAGSDSDDFRGRLCPPRAQLNAGSPWTTGHTLRPWFTVYCIYLLVRIHTRFIELHVTMIGRLYVHT